MKEDRPHRPVVRFLVPRRPPRGRSGPLRSVDGELGGESLCRAGPQDGKSVTPGTNGSEDVREPEDGKSVTPGTNGSEYAEEPWEPEAGKSVTPGTNGTPSVANPSRPVNPAAFASATHAGAAISACCAFVPDGAVHRPTSTLITTAAASSTDSR